MQVLRQPVADVPPATSDRRTILEEVAVVLALSLLASAASAILSLFEAPIAGTTVAAANQSPLFARQVLGFVFGLAPVFLVLHLVRRAGETPAVIGMAWDRPRSDLARGLLLAGVVGVAGIGIYLGAVALGVNRFVVPAPPPGHWWTYPAVAMHALEAGLVEEVIVLGYLITRLQQAGASAGGAVAASAVLRGSYHLYQGFGGFVGTAAMGLLFGWLFVRTRRTWPFVIAHVALDVGAAVGWLLFRERLPGF